jgi:hypothetical protein
MMTFISIIFAERKMKIKNLMLALCAAVTLSGFCAEKKKSPFAAMDAARATFNKLHGEVFRGTKALDYRVIDCGFRFDCAKGDSEWIIAMPLKNDSRIKFVKARFKDGKFVSGDLMKFGLKSEKIDEAAFEALRYESAMLAVKEGEGGKGRVCAFYPAGKVKPSVRNNLIPHGNNIMLDPDRYYLGKLCGIDRVLGVSMKDVKYVYSITTADGDEIEVGTEKRGYRMVGIVRRALEKKYPEKKGLFSDRDIVDMYCTATVTYKPVPKNGQKAK